MIARRYEEQPLGERFDPFHDPYLADAYPFLAEARTVTRVFYDPDVGQAGRKSGSNFPPPDSRISYFSRLKCASS